MTTTTALLIVILIIIVVCLACLGVIAWLMQRAPEGWEDTSFHYGRRK